MNKNPSTDFSNKVLRTGLRPRTLIRRYWFILRYELSCSTAECTKHSLAEVERIFERFSANAGFYNQEIQ